MSLTFSELIKNKVVQAALAIVAVIAAGSVAYYLAESREPALAYAQVATSTVSQTVSATGIVSPLQNPTLTFTTGGRVTYLNAKVGQKVAAGTLLASVDTGVLTAERASAQAALNKLLAGPREVDVAGKQTAVASAQTSLATSEATFPAAIQSAQSTVESAVGSTDALFRNPNNAAPQLYAMYNRDTDVRSRIDSQRANLNNELDALAKSQVAQGESTSALDAQASATLDALQDADTFLAALSDALNDARTEGDLSAAQIGNTITAVNASRASVDSAIRALTDAEQQNSSASLAVTSAQNDLALASAPARPEDVQAAEAQLASIDAQIRNAEIIAPFSGTVASVNVKAGDVVDANTDALALLPNGTTEVDVYLSEAEVAMLQTGDKADVTLDAFGSGTDFPATVSTIDAAPSTASDGSGATGYKVVLVFDQANPSIGIGMHANAVIHGRSKEGVLSVPRTSLIMDGTSAYVLKKTPDGAVKTPVTVGLMGEDSAEITSGLSAGDMVARVGGTNS